MIAYDICTIKQIEVMANFAETKLAHNLEEEHNVNTFFNFSVL